MRLTRLRIGCVVMAGGIATAGVADAAVLCKRRSGAVVVRDACKKKETPLDLAEFGAMGPQGLPGEPGPTGPTGPAGTARAYATVNGDGTTSRKGGTLDLSVERTGTGNYCVVVPAEVMAVNGTAVATLEQPGGTDIVSIGSRHGSSCNPLNTETTSAFPVYVRTTAGAAIDRAFLIVIP